MSDPVTHAEIEDVLSSIRRLVSEDGQPTQPAPKPAGRLVLTPALRVRERPEPAPDRELAEGEAARDDASSDGAAAALEHLAGPDCLQLKRADVVSTSESGADSSVGNGPEQPGRTPGGPSATAGIPPAAAEQAVDAPGGEAQDPEAPWSNPRATLFSAATAASPVNADVDTAGRRAASVLQKIAELEAKVARAPGDWEPDGNPRDAFSGTANGSIAWQDEPEPEGEVEASAAAQPEDRSGSDPDTDRDMAEAALTDTALESLPPDAAYHDEDSLRELVSAIVREELQGALGERITRNVRKLVRREIHRVLATQDLL